MISTEWFRSAVKERWWSLPDSHIRMAWTLVAMSDDRLVVETTGDALAERCGTSRSSARRALSALAEHGFCTVQASRGRGQLSTITLASRGHLISEHVQEVSSVTVESVAIKTWPFESVEPGHLEATEIVCVSLADLGDRGHFKSRKLAIFESKTGQNAPDPPIFPRASDQDLLRSPKTLRSDLRSSDLEILSKYVPTWTEQKEELMIEGQEAAATEPNDETEPGSPGKPKTRRRIDAAKIPERAWAAADYLRCQVMASNGAAVVGTKPWEPGWSWQTGKANRTGDGSRTGLRLTWANSLRLFSDVVRATLKNDSRPSTDEHAWDEIALSVRWLFHAQDAELKYRLVVESPDALRAKWDAIQHKRKAQRSGDSGHGSRGNALNPPASDTETLAAKRLLSHLGKKAKVAYTGMPQHVDLIARQLRSGVTEVEMEAVIAYCDSTWNKPELRYSLRPETLFGFETISKYLDQARTKYAAQIQRGSVLGQQSRPAATVEDDPPIHPMFAAGWGSLK